VVFGLAAWRACARGRGNCYEYLFFILVCVVIRTELRGLAANWPLHDIAITNIAWCMAYKRGVGGASKSAQWACISIAIVRAMQVEGGNTRIIDSCTKSSK